MARFYAEIQGNRGSATRMGTAASGIWGHIRGWNIGARVDCDTNDTDDDEVTVSVTTGSNGRCLGSARGDVLLTITQGSEPLDGPNVVLADTPGMRDAAARLLATTDSPHGRPLSHKQF